MSPPLPASFAMIPDSVVTSLPHYGGQGCQAIGITPEDVRQGIVDNPPAGFNPLPSTYPIPPELNNHKDQWGRRARDVLNF